MNTGFKFLLSLLLAVSACYMPTAPDEIDRNQALEIARQQVSFEPETVIVEKTTEDNRLVWRVSFRSAPLSPRRPFSQVMIVTIDRLTGAVVGLSRN